MILLLYLALSISMTLMAVDVLRSPGSHGEEQQATANWGVWFHIQIPQKLDHKTLLTQILYVIQSTIN